MRGFLVSAGLAVLGADVYYPKVRRRRRGWALGFAATVGRSALPTASLRHGVVIAAEGWDLRHPLWGL
jgi:hypothetical protein